MSPQAPPAPRVPMVDDEPNVADVVPMALRSRGLDVATAATAGDALRTPRG